MARAMARATVTETETEMVGWLPAATSSAFNVSDVCLEPVLANIGFSRHWRINTKGRFRMRLFEAVRCLCRVPAAVVRDTDIAALERHRVAVCAAGRARVAPANNQPVRLRRFEV